MLPIDFLVVQLLPNGFSVLPTFPSFSEARSRAERLVRRHVAAVVGDPDQADRLADPHHHGERRGYRCRSRQQLRSPRRRRGARR